MIRNHTLPRAVRCVASVLIAATLALGWAAGTADPAAAQAPAARTPLLIEGKTTLYQRVLTRPGARLAASPGAPGGTALAPMSVLFVYARQDIGESIYLEVGPASDGRTTGWLEANETIPWRHTLVLAFTNPANRDRTLFLRDRDSLIDLLQSDDILVKAETWRRQIADKSLPPDGPVISIEPENHVDLQKQFYLLPILEAKSTLLPSGFRVRTVQVASVTKEADPPAEPLQRGNAEADLANFRSGVVFVIDASSSMQPYIDRTREAIDAVYKEVEAADLGDRVRFGMIAYRDDPDKAKGVEYLTRTFADPNETDSKAKFMEQVSGLNASPASTRAFAEDAYAGLEKAIESIDWTGFGGKYVVLITDASAREGYSPIASTGLSTDQVAQLARKTGVALYAMHLKTPEGRHDHAAAEGQYRRLSDFPGFGSLYFPVEAGDAERFRAQVQALAHQLVGQVRDAAKPPSEAPPPPAADDRLAQATEAVGRAMRLAYLGTVQGTRAPTMFEAWASDRDFKNPELAAFEVRVLLTKNQLSDLQSTLRRVVEAGEHGQVDPGDFFNQLRSAAVAMGRDPSRIAQGDARNLEEVGLMGEYLEGLPYQSTLMAIDPDGWTRMGVGEQQAIIDTIKSKVALYQRYHDDVGQWVQLDPGAGAGDAVFPVPIDALP